MKSTMHLRASSQLFANAKSMRANPTKAEEILWKRLRGNQTGYKFRRQHPICNYIVDFYCHALKLAIEVDGEIHLDPMHQLEDDNKDLTLNENFINVLRFTNNQVINNIDAVMEQIHKTLKELYQKYVSIDEV